MKKIVRYLSYLLMPILVLSLVYYDRIVPFISGLNTGEGILLGIFTFIGDFFKDADGFNIIFMIVILLSLMIAFIGLDLLLSRLLNKVNHPFLSFLKKDWFRLSFQKIAVVLFVGVVFTALANAAIFYIGAKRTVTVEGAEKNPALVLGTSKHLSSNPDAENLYYTYRINKAVELYEKGKVEYFILSGDETDSIGYSEVDDMEESLIANGVPAQLIKKDGNGYRTLDSMLRLRELYGLSEFTIVSQGFHIPRALFLAWFYSMNPVGVAAEGTSTSAMVKREILAKPKVILDLFFFNMQPKASKHQIRENFTVNTEASAWLIVLVAVSIITVLWAFFNIMEQRTKGIWKKLAIASTSTVGAIFMVIVVYKNSEIEAVDNFVKNISESTGVLKDVVAKKETKKKKVALAKIKVDEKEKEVIAEIEEFIIDDSLDLDLDSLDLDIEKGKENNDDVFSSVAINTNPVTKSNNNSAPNTEAEIRNEEPTEEDLFFGSITQNNSTANNPENKKGGGNEITLKVKIHKSVVATHDTKLQLRLLEATLIGGQLFQEGYVFDGRVILKSGKIGIEFSLGGQKGELIDENGNRLLSEKSYQKDSKGYLISTGLSQLAKI